MLRLTATLAAVLLSAAGVYGQKAQTQAPKPAQPKPLHIGDKAPAIDISDWMIGDKIDGFKKGHVYVIEFWATWCPPCRASMPHLSETQEKYKDKNVTIIGISDEPVDTVAKFLSSKDGDVLWKDKIHYRLTTDPDKSAYRDYFYATGQTGIPTAFIIGKDGRLEWLGHPMEMDKPLKAVVEDKWDRDKFKYTFEHRAEIEKKARKIYPKLNDAYENEDWDTALELLDQLIGLDEDMFSRLNANKAMIYILHTGEVDKGLAILRKEAKKEWDNGQALNGLAWSLVDNTGVKDKKVLDFAMQVGMRANELTGGKDASTLDTVARIFYEQGNVKEAIRWEKMAVDNASEDRMRDSLQKTLEKYQSEG